MAEGEADDEAGGDEEVADVGVDQRPLGVLEPRGIRVNSLIGSGIANNLKIRLRIWNQIWNRNRSYHPPLQATDVD